jgi:hypothetical protein
LRFSFTSNAPFVSVFAVRMRLSGPGLTRKSLTFWRAAHPPRGVRVPENVFLEAVNFSDALRATAGQPFGDTPAASVGQRSVLSGSPSPSVSSGAITGGMTGDVPGSVPGGVPGSVPGGGGAHPSAVANAASGHASALSGTP